MKVVIAPDSFKGSLTASQVANTIQRAFIAVMPDASVVTVPMADGGEGTLDALINATNGKKVACTAQGPLMHPVSTHFGVLGDGVTAVIEMAQVSGLTMVPKDQLNPEYTSTYGVGELVTRALDEGYRKFVIGVGGSATNDGGLGLLQALGGRFLDAQGRNVSPVAGSLFQIQHVDLSGLDSRLQESKISIASDVENPLCGSNGASAVFGPQKGATPHQVKTLDAALSHYAGLVEESLGKSLQDLPGAGAAGGIGFALMALGAVFASGGKLVAFTAGLDKQLEGADYVITGEGQTDSQTLFGKVPYVVAQLAQAQKVKPILLSGSLAETAGESFHRLKETFVSIHSILSRPMTTAEAMADAESLLYTSAWNLAKLLALTY
ncbi:glycerate kinase [Alicyclobacillus sp. SO9]|uniref:glycerate kinase n=1 Tax=Alicyclobacillus sp. SO9 TaxID=2665646 RepID=UPI0018E78DA3|nr:glycerate kinase [Alicyclobacillus sp. SO9]QQE79115.1 glycerate kinase [Alicyclobacillus sp. SO9]